MEAIGPYIVGAAFCGLIGMVIGGSRSIGAGGGFFVGFLLGPIGWIFALVSSKNPPPSTLDRIERRPEATGWHPDPLGRFDFRWFDGNRWTQHVGRVGSDGTRAQFEDPL